jgi:hypothetical protein
VPPYRLISKVENYLEYKKIVLTIKQEAAKAIEQFGWFFFLDSSQIVLFAIRCGFCCAKLVDGKKRKKKTTA